MAEIVDADFLKQRLPGTSPDHCVRKTDLTKDTVTEVESASYISPSSVFVKETGRAYIYDPASTATRDGIRVLTPAGGGRLVAMKGLISTDGVHLKGDGSASDPVEHSQDTADLFRFFVGAIISGYSAECLITSNGSTVTASVQSVGGGDIKYVTTDGYAILDCTPAATVALTAGTDSAPVTNWIYINISSGLLESSTAGFPSSPYVPIDKRLIPSASFVQNYGTYPGNNFSDHVYSAGDNGHLTHLNQNFRLRPPVYISGASTTISGSATANCTVAVASGEILMNHLRTTYSFADGSNLLVANDQTTPYQVISNLYNLATDTTGATLTGRWAAHFIWYGHAQEASGAKLFINKPSGTYLSADEARSDTNGYFNSSVPPAFRGCAIGLRRVVARRSATGTIEINYKTSDDWRGKSLSSVAGSGGTTSFSSIFPTSDFRLEDTTDASKKIAFSASAIATGQTRTISMPNNDVDLAPASRIASPSQSGLMSTAQAQSVANSAVAGSSGQVQYNNNGVLSASSQFYWDINGLNIQGWWAKSIFSGENFTIRKPDYTSGVWARSLLDFQEYNGTSYFQVGAFGSNNTFSYGFVGAAHNNTTIRWYTDKNVIFAGNVGKNVTPTARDHTKGETSDNTAYAVKIDNSSNSKLFYVRNDGQLNSSGSRIIEYGTVFTSDATLTESSNSCAVINPSGTGVVITMHLSLPGGIKQRTVNVSGFAVTLGRNGQLMAGLAANYTLSARTAIDWQYYGATTGWIPISISTW